VYEMLYDKKEIEQGCEWGGWATSSPQTGSSRALPHTCPKKQRCTQKELQARHSLRNGLVIGTSIVKTPKSCVRLSAAFINKVCQNSPSESTDCVEFKVKRQKVPPFCISRCLSSIST